jgi:hypothetical protein
MGTDMGTDADRGFHLGLGGPLHRVERASHLGLGRLIVASIAITWLPLVVLSLAHGALSGRIEPMLRELSIHARCLVAIPLFLIGERLLDRTCDLTVARVFNEGFVRSEDEAGVRAMLRRTEDLCNSPWPEGLLILVALGVGIASWFGVLHEPGVEHVVERRGAAGAWYALVSMPLFQFLLWRSLFRWALWVRVLVGLSRLPLRLRPAHPDRRAGIAFLKLPSVGYCAVLLLATSSVLSSAWATEILVYGAKLDTFKPLFVVFVFIGSLIAFGPLLLFVPALFVARRRGQIQFGGLVSDYAAQFENRWLANPARTELLGTPDAQSLADLGSSYRETIEKMQLLLFGPRDAIILFVASQLPAIPLLLTQVPAREVLSKLLHLLTGGARG